MASKKKFLEGQGAITMKTFTPQEMKPILHSHRANLYYLEKCRVMQKDGRVLYLSESAKENLYWNIPLANTTVVMLGTGTSITQAAVRMLASAGVLVGFCGTGATPLFAGCEIEWLTPQSEYRPTQYVQGWLSMWFDEAKRLSVAKEMQQSRCDYLQRVWEKDKDLQSASIYVDDYDVETALKRFRKNIKTAANVTELLTAEAAFTKAMYKYVATVTDYGDFVRDPEGDGANELLNHGNYLAYGLGAVTLWVLGIPHGFAVMHGKTRRGALVFDVADLVKDALILPWAFVGSIRGMNQQAFRKNCLEKFVQHKALEFMFQQVEKYSLGGSPKGEGDAL